MPLSSDSDPWRPATEKSHTPCGSDPAPKGRLATAPPLSLDVVELEGQDVLGTVHVLRRRWDQFRDRLANLAQRLPQRLPSIRRHLLWR